MIFLIGQITGIHNKPAHILACSHTIMLPYHPVRKRKLGKYNVELSGITA